MGDRYPGVVGRRAAAGDARGERVTGPLAENDDIVGGRRDRGLGQEQGDEQGHGRLRNGQATNVRGLQAGVNGLVTAATK
ncbi:hypothetical protein FHR19_001800 [Sphingomonas yantingensis]|uniref:Uncharacterized protein n=1 Tax=Sphingomonas yantingensis TaxID=1241761 RepID=A0A7W9AQ28_9SPHN|nr:hypothetical protein [Sphingomonas yantingensis]